MQTGFTTVGLELEFFNAFCAHMLQLFMYVMISF